MDPPVSELTGRSARLPTSGSFRALVPTVIILGIMLYGVATALAGKSILGGSIAGERDAVKTCTP